MASIFHISEENAIARCCHRARISTVLMGKRLPSRRTVKHLNDKDKPQSFQLGLLRPGLRRAGLTVLAPRRPALLAGTQNPGVQTIPFKPDTL